MEGTNENKMKKEIDYRQGLKMKTLEDIKKEIMKAIKGQSKPKK